MYLLASEKYLTSFGPPFGLQSNINSLSQNIYFFYCLRQRDVVYHSLMMTSSFSWIIFNQFRHCGGTTIVPGIKSVQKSTIGMLTNNILLPGMTTVCSASASASSPSVVVAVVLANP